MQNQYKKTKFDDIDELIYTNCPLNQRQKTHSS